MLPLCRYSAPFAADIDKAPLLQGSCRRLRGPQNACNHQIFHYYIRVIKLYAGAEMSGNKIESGKKGKFLRILTSHYRLIIFILMWIFLTFLWFIGPENDPELSYFVLLLFCSVVLGLFFVFIEILEEIPKTIRKIIEKFGKDSGDDRSFLEKFSEIIFHSVASTLLFFVLATAVMTAIAACIEPYIFAENSSIKFAGRLFLIVVMMWALSPLWIILLNVFDKNGAKISKTPAKNKTSVKTPTIHWPQLIASILIGYSIIMAVSVLIEPLVEPHFPSLFGSDFIENTMLVGLLISSAIGVLYLLFRFPAIPIYLIAIAITLIFGTVFLVVLVGTTATLSLGAVLSWAVFFSIMRPKTEITIIEKKEVQNDRQD